MKKRKHLHKNIFILLMVIIASILLYAYLRSQYFLMKTISSKGYVEMKVSEIILIGEEAVIKLKNRCFEFSFYTSSHQAQSIDLGISNQIPFRPTTHDITKSILERYGIKPILVKITKMEEGTYFAELTLQRGFSYMTIDIRPSDAVALAVRTKTPIYVNESLAMKIC